MTIGYPAPLQFFLLCHVVARLTQLCGQHLEELCDIGEPFSGVITICVTQRLLTVSLLFTAVTIVQFYKTLLVYVFTYTALENLNRRRGKCQSCYM